MQHFHLARAWPRRCWDGGWICWIFSKHDWFGSATQAERRVKKNSYFFTLIKMFTNFAIKSHSAAISCKKILDFSSSTFWKTLLYGGKKKPFLYVYYYDILWRNFNFQGLLVWEKSFLPIITSPKIISNQSWNIISGMFVYFLHVS